MDPKPAPAAPTAPPADVSSMPLGVDVSAYQGNLKWTVLANAGKVFGIAKSTQGSTWFDPTFAPNWSGLKAAGMIRGTFAWMNADPVASQVANLIKRLPRILPGDLPPALDLEQESLQSLGKAELLKRAQDWMDRVEEQLGRMPIMYTGVLWRDFLMSKSMADYPLWTAHPSPRLGGGATGQVFGGWTDWAFWQYAEDGKPYPLNPIHGVVTQPAYHEPAIKSPGIDFDAFNGSIWQLRGVADLGQTAPYASGSAHCVAYTETDGHVHLMCYDEFWLDDDLTKRRSTPPAAGDPAAAIIGTREVIVYRSSDGHVRVFTRDQLAADPAWEIPGDPEGIGIEAVSDPAVFVDGTQLHVTYWRDDNHLQHLWCDASGSDGLGSAASWQAADMTQDSAGPNLSGDPVAYSFGGALHAVSRAGTDGHLYDLWSEGDTGKQEDITHAAPPSAGLSSTPAATYTPAVFYWPAVDSSDPVPHIVFRAIRGAIWDIARDTLQATNLSDAAGGAPTAAGSPTAFVVGAVPHVVYRGVDGKMYDFSWTGGSNSAAWGVSPIDCAAKAAADPSAYVISGGAGQAEAGCVTYRGADGGIYRLTLGASGWSCELQQV